MASVMDEPGALAAKLRAEGDKLIAYLHRLSDDEWKIPVYAEGTTWTVRSIVAHLMTAERAFLGLFERIRQGEPGISEDFSIDRYNARQQEKTGNLSRSELLGELEAARGQMVAFVADLPAEDLEHKSRHPFLGITSLREMVKMIYIHNQTHLRDIRRSIRGE